MNQKDNNDDKTDSISAFFFVASKLMSFGEDETNRKGDGIMRSLLNRQKMALFIIESKTRTEPKGIRLSMIAKSLGIPLPSASLLVESLVKKGLCRRVVNPANRRSVNITLTVSGHKMLKKIIVRTRQKFQEIQCGLSQEDIQVFEKVVLFMLAKFDS